MNVHGNARPASRPTGSRPNGKVRRVAKAHRGQLGELRHVEAARFGRWFWLVVAVLVLLCTIGPILGDISTDRLSLLFTGGGIAVLWLLLLALLWALTQLKLLVFERGIVLGNFLPFMTPMAVPFDAIVPGSFRAVRGLSMPRDLDRVLGPGRATMSHEQVLYPLSGYGLCFRAVRASVVRGADDWSPAGASQFDAEPLDTSRARLWEFKVVNEERLIGLVHTLQRVLTEGGYPGAAEVSTRALPVYRVFRVGPQVDPSADAAHLGLPDPARPATAPPAAHGGS